MTVVVRGLNEYGMKYFPSQNGGVIYGVRMSRGFFLANGPSSDVLWALTSSQEYADCVLSTG